MEREEPLTSSLTAGGAAPASSGPTEGGRSVSFGSVPDFAFEGEGMRFDGVTPDSPAAKAGFQAGDILIRIDATEIKSLRDFSNCLKTLSPDQTVSAVVLRDGVEKTAEVTLTAR